MASFSISAEESKAEITTLPNWLELPIEITANILRRVDTIDIVTKVCHVCPLWWKIFKNPLMWCTIRMNNALGNANLGLNFLDIFRYAVDRSCGNLEVVDIEYYDTDDLLQCMATKDVRNLRRMRIVDFWSISDAGFIKVVKNLPCLEELDMTLMYLSHDSLEVLAQSCPLLKSLKVGIANPLYRVGHFGDVDKVVTEDGWLAILDRCNLLESLDIHRCLNLVLSESLMKRFQEQIKDLRLPQIYWKLYDGQVSYHKFIR